MKAYAFDHYMKMKGFLFIILVTYKLVDMRKH